MKKLLDLLFYRHRRFKGQSYFRHHFAYSFGVNVIFSLLLGESYLSYLGIFLFLMIIDVSLAIGAWFYYPTDL
ncbi:hypothetical protein [Marinicellulosiphila megalodicopiae]|uniref:hypothetical protein n=1 Tax=Marinicellulosiphila megalodicopiae TaxID=2724896 RepID=UPI003BAEBE9C